MTEAEALEIAANYLSNCLGAVTLYMSVTFGYLVVCYQLGAQLRKLEVIGITGLYLTASFSAYISFLNANRFYASVLQYIPTHVDNNPFANPVFWEISGSIVCIAGIIASLYFMRYIRQSAK